MKKAIHQKWLDRVQYDIETAEAMLKTGRYIYTVFMCQQALEKCLKALMAFQKKEIVPLHNLRRLAEATDIIHGIGAEDLKKIDFLSQYYLNARYKEDIEELSIQITADLSKKYLTFTREKIEWLCLKMTP